METLLRLKTEFGLSFAEFSALCGGAAAGCSRSTIRNLCLGSASQAIKSKVYPKIETAVTTLLQQKGRDHRYLQDVIDGLRVEFGAHQPCPEDTMLARVKMPLQAQRFFKLSEDPFTTRTKEVFSSARLDAITHSMLTAIKYQDLISITGPVGAGKTTLKLRLKVELNRINSDPLAKYTYKLLMPSAIDHSKVTPRGIVGFILKEFKRKVPADTTEQRRALEELLEHEYLYNRRIALVFDECHLWSIPALLSLKEFYELSDGFDAYLGVIMFGHPKLKTLIESDVRLRGLNERMQFLEIPEFTGQEAWDYVTHRLAGANGNADVLFDRQVVETLAASHPTPLALGNACNAALNLAFSVGEAKVTQKLVHPNAVPEKKLKTA